MHNICMLEGFMFSQPTYTLLYKGLANQTGTDAKTPKCLKPHLQTKAALSYTPITRNLAQENPEFWSMVKSLYPSEENKITDNDLPLPDKLIEGKQFEEPTDDEQYKKYVDLVNNNEWDKLQTHFADTEFILHIFKVFRKTKLNADQMATINLLYEGSRFFTGDKGKYTIHSFNDVNGLLYPYHFEKILIRAPKK